MRPAISNINWWMVLELPESRRKRKSIPFRCFQLPELETWAHRIAQDVASQLNSRGLWKTIPDENLGGCLWVAVHGETPATIQVASQTAHADLVDRIVRLLTDGGPTRDRRPLDHATLFGWKVSLQTDGHQPSPTVMDFERVDPGVLTTQKKTGNRFAADVGHGNVTTATSSMQSTRSIDDHDGRADKPEEGPGLSHEDLEGLVTEVQANPVLQQLLSQLVSASRAAVGSPAAMPLQVISSLNAIGGMEVSESGDAGHTLGQLASHVEELRQAIGTVVFSRINTWAGMRWDLEESRRVATHVDAIAKSLGLSFLVETKDGEKTETSLRCNPTGRDKVPSFEYEGVVNGRKRYVHSTREFEALTPVPALPDTRRRAT